MNKQVVINSCYGGFSLSEKAFVEYLKRKGINCVTEVNEFGWVDFYKNSISDENYISHYDYVSPSNLSTREDPDLIAIIEEIGEESFGMFASLKIVEIPDDVEYEITEFDGLETIREKCRTWC
jgi:hypothetical protein